MEDGRQIFVATPYDQFAPYWPYIEGIQVKGCSRVVVESVSEKLTKAAAKNVSSVVEENDGGAGPDHENWKNISQRVTIVVGHANQ